MSSFNVPLMRWLVMQLIKGEPTLRVGVKGDKPRPRLVYRFGFQEHGVKEFLKFRRQKCYFVESTDAHYPNNYFHGGEHVEDN